MLNPLNFLSKFIKSNNQKELDRLGKIVAKINTLEESMVNLSDSDFPKKTSEFKEKVGRGETLDSILPEAFALVREASKRVRLERHFDVQLIGGIVLHESKIAERDQVINDYRESGGREWEDIKADHEAIRNQAEKLYNKSVEKFQSNHLKNISVSGFFTNIFYLCENNAHVFFGKPLVNLSFYQLELFGYGRYYKSMIENSEKKPPEHISEDPEKLVEWFESTKSAAETLDKSEAKAGEHGATSLVGATKDDLKRLGLDNPGETISLAKKAAEKGGRLTMDDMMKIHGA